MKYFHFERLIRKYSRQITAIIPEKGAYSNGEYVKSDRKIELSAAIFDVDRKKIRDAGGVLTSRDKQLYVIGTMTDEIIGASVIHEGIKYSVEEDTDNSYFTGFSSYILKYVSAFGGKE